MPQAYRIIGKTHRRMTLTYQETVALDGTRVVVPQNGPMLTFPVGSILTDVTADELASFPDRFVPASAAELAAQQASQTQRAHLEVVTSAADRAYADKLAAVQVEHAMTLARLQAEHAAEVAMAAAPAAMDQDSTPTYLVPDVPVVSLPEGLSDDAPAEGPPLGARPPHRPHR